MSQHARDTFGNEASREQDRGKVSVQSRGQDAIPIEQAVEDSKDREENLTELRGLVGQARGADTPVRRTMPAIPRPMTTEQ